MDNRSISHLQRGNQSEQEEKLRRVESLNYRDSGMYIEK